MKLISSILVIIFLLSACGTQKRVDVKAKEFPSWYSSPSQSDSNTLYAIGEGENKAVAINTALSEILASLSVSISSEFNSKTQVSKGTVESYRVTSSKNINAKVQEIKINNYEVTHENDFGFEKYLVGVKIEKKRLFEGLKQEVDSKFSHIKLKSMRGNAIKQLESYQEDKTSIHNVQNILSVMQALDSSFDATPYVKKMQNIDKKHSDLLAKISFSLHVNRDALNLKPSISKGLSDKKFQLNSAQGKNHFRIYIYSSTIKAKSYGFNLARSAIDIKVKDFKETVIGSNKINLTGQSTQGYKIAKENVAIKLDAMIKKDGIAKIVGLGI